MSQCRQRNVLSHHITSPSPYALDSTSLLCSAIIDHKVVSTDIFKKLQKIDVVFKGGIGIVDTTRIDAKFTHHLAKIPVYQQKQIIDLLFWWEEECSRTRKLQAEEAELTALPRNYANDRNVYSRVLPPNFGTRKRQFQANESKQNEMKTKKWSGSDMVR